MLGLAWAFKTSKPMLVIHLVQEGKWGVEKGSGRGLKKSEEGPQAFYGVASEVMLCTEQRNPFKQLYSLVTKHSNV